MDRKFYCCLDGNVLLFTCSKCQWVLSGFYGQTDVHGIAHRSFESHDCEDYPQRTHVLRWVPA